MKIFIATLSILFASRTFAAANIFECDFTATEGLNTKTAKINISSPDVGAKVMYMSNGELIFALPSVSDSSAQLELFVGGSCENCAAERFYQTEAFQKGMKKNFSDVGAFTGDQYAKSVFSYKLIVRYRRNILASKASGVRSGN